MDANPAPEAGGEVSAPYWRFVFSLVCFTIVAASGMFLLAWATVQGSPNAFTQNSVSLAGLIGTGIWAALAWSGIRRVEPETNPAFRQKHRAFGLKAGTTIAVVLVGAVAVGAYRGVRAGHQARLGVLSEQVSELGVKNAPTKQRFIQVAMRNTRNLPGYLQRCADLETAINDYEPVLQQMDNLMSQTQPELEELKTDPGFARLLPSVTVIRSVLGKDLEAAKAYRKEIAYAKQLPGVPESERTRFYNTNIQPVVDEEGRIAKDEIEILKAAKERGVQLPESMYREVGIN